MMENVADTQMICYNTDKMTHSDSDTEEGEARFTFGC